MKNLVTYRLFVLCSAALIVAGCSNSTDADLVKSAAKRIDKREFAGALLDLKSALQKTPDSAEARHLLGIVYLEQGDAAGALAELRRAEGLGLDKGRLAPKLARAMLANDKVREVIDAFAAVKPETAGDRAELSTALAMAYAMTSRRADAEASLADALSAVPKYPWALMVKAKMLLGEKKYEEALVLAEQAAAAGAPNGDAHLLRGMLLQHVRRDEAAAHRAFEMAAADPREEIAARTIMIELALRKADIDAARKHLAALVKVHPKHMQVLYLDAVVAYAARDYVRSEAVAEQLLRFAPDSAPLLVLAGASSLQRGALVTAEAKLGRVVKTVAEAANARRLLAETYLRMGETGKALQTLQPLLEQGKPDAETLSLAAQAHLQAGDFKRAEALFVSAASIQPEKVELRVSLALIELAKGRTAAAVESLQSIAAQDARDTADMALITALMRRRDFDAALTAIAALQKKRVGKAQPVYLRGVALQRKGETKGAKAAFEEALGLEPSHFPSIHAIASIEEAAGEVAAARKRLETVVAAQPKNAAARVALLDLALRAKDPPDKILAGIEQGITAIPSEAALRLTKIIQLSRMKDVKGAALAAQQALAAIPDHPDLLDASGLAFAAAGDDQQAISTFNKLASVEPKSARAHLRLAEAHAKRGMQSAAHTSLLRALEVEPGSQQVHQRLIAQAAKARDFKPVIEAAKAIQKSQPQRSAGFDLEGDAHARAGRNDLAIAVYRAGLQAAPSTQGAIRLHRALVAAGSAAAASAHAQQWTAKYPRDAAFQAFMGDAARREQDWVKAEQHYLAAIAIEPDHAGVLNNLAWVTGRQNKPEAVGYAERAVALSPDQPALLDTLAELLAAKGQHDSAIGWWRRALVASPDDARLKLSLARALLHVGKKGEARSLLEDLARIGGSFPAQGEVAALLAKAGN